MLSKNKKLSLWELVLITVATNFEFLNVFIAYYQMSYASMLWYAVGAITFFIPLALMIAEYGSAIRNDSGGFYTWLINSVGEKWAFIGTFIWVCDFIVIILEVSSNKCVAFSELLYGGDRTGSWHLGSIGSTGVFSLIAILIVLLATMAACRGLHNVATISIIGGVMSFAIVIVFFAISLALIIINKGQLAQPFHGMTSLLKSPNSQFQSPMAIMSFIVYAIFAYGGIESVSGMIDKLKDPRKNFPRAMLISAALVIIIYIAGIWLCGYSINWQHVFGTNGINLANDSYVLMGNLGMYLAKSLGLSFAAGKWISVALVRFTAFSIIINTVGIVIVLVYSPLKGLIAGSSKDLWPKKVAKFNKYDMPSRAMWIQFAIIAFTLIMIAITGKNGQNFFTIIVDMNNVSSIFPYYFLVIGFLAFKKRRDLQRPFVAFNSKRSTDFFVGLVIVSMTFGAVTSLLAPILQGQYMDAFWSFIGPIFFYAVATALYHFGLKRRAKRLGIAK